MGGAGGRRNRKGRAMGEMIMAIKKEMMEKGTEVEVRREGLMYGRIRKAEERWRIVGVYVGKGEMERISKKLEEWIRNREEIRTIIGGDFYARIGKEGEEIEEKKRGEKVRRRG